MATVYIVKRWTVLALTFQMSLLTNSLSFGALLQKILQGCLDSHENGHRKIKYFDTQFLCPGWLMLAFGCFGWVMNYTQSTGYSDAQYDQNSSDLGFFGRSLDSLQLYVQFGTTF